MSEFTNTRSTLMPFPEAKMEKLKEWCDKHQCQMVKIAKTGAVICPQCNKEERLEFEEQKAQGYQKTSQRDIIVITTTTIRKTLRCKIIILQKVNI